MKALILTVTAGQGHNSTAASVQSHFTSAGIECRILDSFYCINKALGYILEKGYLLTVDSLSGLYSRTYKKLERRSSSERSLLYKIIEHFTPKLLEQINAFSPDIIVCTHVFSALSVSILKKKGALDAVTIGIVTDFTMHPYWEETTNIEYILLPSERLECQCGKKGYKKSQMLFSGIPINSKFEEKIDKREAKKRLGLVPDKPLVTVMSGSMCYASVTEIVKNIDKLKVCFQVAAVCGSSKEEYNRLKSIKTRHKILKYGYTDKISLLMDASDCIITKPGGLSVSEALSKHLPMLLNNPIPGHEERNLTFLVNNGVAKAVSDNCPIEELLYQFLTNEKLRTEMLEAAVAIGKPDAANALTEFVLSLEKQ